MKDLKGSRLKEKLRLEKNSRTLKKIKRAAKTRTEHNKHVTKCNYAMQLSRPATS